MTQVEADLGFRPRPWQRAVRRRLKRQNVVVVHRRGGKTYLAVQTLVDAALRTKKKMARYGYLAPLLKQARAISWDYLVEFASKVPGAKPNKTELTIDFPNGARIGVFGADNYEALRGLYFDGLVMDELKDIKPEVYDEVIVPALEDRRGWLFCIGTPKGTNLLSERYYAALKDPAWNCELLTVHDTDVFNEQQLKHMRRNMRPAKFRQELECDFSASAEDVLITLDMVERGLQVNPRREDYEWAPKILGVDVARYGDDRSCIFPRQGLVAFKPVVIQDIDNMALADKVATAIKDWGADATFVDAGRGEGVIDRLRQLGHNPIPVNFGGTKGIRGGFYNHRSQMWQDMADWLNEGGAIPDVLELRVDLTGPVMDFSNPRNVLRLESKDQLRKRGLPSPDLADALALTFAAPVKSKRSPLDREAYLQPGRKAKRRSRIRDATRRGR